MAVDAYEGGLRRLEGAATVAGVLAVLDVVTEAVVEQSPCMTCVPGCSDCCHHQVLAGFGEWQHVLAYVHAHLTPDAQRALVMRAEALLADPRGAVAAWLKLRDKDPRTRAYLRAFNRVVENVSTPCPFLVEGRCSIYPARPAICRAYGRMMRTERSAYYCTRILANMQRAGPLDALELPVFQPYHRVVLRQADGSLDEVNLLPIWILAHRAPDGTLRSGAQRVDPASPFPVVDGYWSYDDD
ncbi:MAG: YkgJ family cysteine cluster protein [Actinobacteria bacterium]|nr:YkgJ family cysteine cluster protein [Actinomycetota bacterium]